MQKQQQTYNIIGQGIANLFEVQQSYKKQITLHINSIIISLYQLYITISIMKPPHNQSNSNHQSQKSPQKHNKKYKPINSYTHRASKQQIVTIIIFVIHLCIHCIFIIRPIIAIDNPALYFVWVLFFIVLVGIIIDYFILTCGDPVDKLIAEIDNKQDWKANQMYFTSTQHNKVLQNSQQSSKNKKNPYRVKQCKQCDKIIKQLSYHCYTCKRCVEDMDHHCKYLNNCIGGRNYSSFFRLLIFTTVYSCLGILIGIWVFYLAFSNHNINQLAFTKWMALVWAIFSFVNLIVVQILLWFHCYISCYLHMTTIQYIYRDTPSNNNMDSNYSSASQSQMRNQF